MQYGSLEEMKKRLLYKRIVEWDENKLVLDDNTVVTLEESENDCCAKAHGNFSRVELDAVITDVEVSDPFSVPDSDTDVNEVRVTLFHNRNLVALAEMTADAGNGGYYYSIGSFVVDGIHFPIVDA